MQYFQALKMGQKRVEASRAYLISISNMLDLIAIAICLYDIFGHILPPAGVQGGASHPVCT